MSPETENGDLLVTLEQRIVVQDPNTEDAYDDNYIRHLTGRIWLVESESGTKIELGTIELYYIDGSRALDNRLDIVDVCDSLGQDVYEYSNAVYVHGVLDGEIIGEALSNDVLALHMITIYPEHRGRKYGLRVTQKIVETVGYQCGAVVLKPMPLQFVPALSENVDWMKRMEMADFGTDPETAEKRLIDYWRKLDLRETRDPTICLVSR